MSRGEKFAEMPSARANFNTTTYSFPAKNEFWWCWCRTETLQALVGGLGKKVQWVDEVMLVRGVEAGVMTRAGG